MSPPNPVPMPTTKDQLTARIGAALVVASFGAERADAILLRSLVAPGRTVDRDECDVVAVEHLLLLLRALPPQALVSLSETFRRHIEALPANVADQLLEQIDESRLFAEGLV